MRLWSRTELVHMCMLRNPCQGVIITGIIIIHPHLEPVVIEFFSRMVLCFWLAKGKKRKKNVGIPGLGVQELERGEK